MSETSTDISLAGLPVARLQDVLAESGAGPAGGSAAALAATMAAGLVRLVARVSADWPEAPGVAAQASALGDRALALADDAEVRDLREQVARLTPRELRAA